MTKQDEKVSYIQFSIIVIPIVALTIALLCAQCCSMIDEYEPANVVEELVEDVLSYQIDKLYLTDFY